MQGKDELRKQYRNLSLSGRKTRSRITGSPTAPAPHSLFVNTHYKLQDGPVRNFFMDLSVFCLCSLNPWKDHKGFMKRYFRVLSPL